MRKPPIIPKIRKSIWINKDDLDYLNSTIQNGVKIGAFIRIAISEKIKKLRRKENE